MTDKQTAGGGNPGRLPKKYQWLIVGVVGTAYLLYCGEGYCRDWQATRQAEAWVQEARQAATFETTPGDARRWLSQHGADEIYWGEKLTVNDVEIDDPQMVGIRKVSGRCIGVKRLTVELEFHFDSQGRFKELTPRIETP
jgi:hypothetical protein